MKKATKNKIEKKIANWLWILAARQPASQPGWVWFGWVACARAFRHRRRRRPSTHFIIETRKTLNGLPCHCKFCECTRALTRSRSVVCGARSIYFLQKSVAAKRPKVCIVFAVSILKGMLRHCACIHHFAIVVPFTGTANNVYSVHWRCTVHAIL